MKHKLAIALCLLLTGCSANTNIHSIDGQFHGNIDAMDSSGTIHTYYQFRADDNSVWWLLTADEIGEIPDDSTKYTLTYDDKGTTSANKPCDCPQEYDCECELYDDVFLNIKSKEEQ